MIDKTGMGVGLMEAGLVEVGLVEVALVEAGLVEAGISILAVTAHLDMIVIRDRESTRLHFRQESTQWEQCVC